MAGLGGTGVSVVVLIGGLAIGSGGEVIVASDDVTDSLDSVFVSCKSGPRGSSSITESMLRLGGGAECRYG